MKHLVIIENKPSRIIETNHYMDSDDLTFFLHLMEGNCEERSLYERGIVKTLPEDCKLLPHYTLSIPEEWYDEDGELVEEKFDEEVIDMLSNKCNNG